MIGVLVFDGTGGEDDARPDAAQNTSQRDGVRGPDLEVSVTVEIDELDRGTKQRGRLLRLGGALLGPAVRGCFPA